MPYPNNHTCRLLPPGQVKVTGSLTFRHEGKTYHAIIGILKRTGKKITQSLRYPIKTWTTAQARAHCKGKGGTFEAAAQTKQTADIDYAKAENNLLIPT